MHIVEDGGKINKPLFINNHGKRQDVGKNQNEKNGEVILLPQGLEVMFYCTTTAAVTGQLF